MPESYAALKRWALRERHLLSLHVDLTAQCPLRCVHCYLGAHQDPGLPQEILLDVLDQAAALGALFLLFSGGEPLLRPDLLELVTAARARRFAVSLATTGIGLSPTMARALVGLGLLEVGISLYAAEPAAHDRVTRQRGSWEQSVAALRLLRSLGQRVRIKAMVFAANAEQWRGLPAFAQAEGCGLSLDTLIFGAEGAGGEHLAEAQSLSSEQRLEVARAQQAWNRSRSRAGPTLAAAGLDDPLCGAGRSALYLHPSGRVQPCMTWRRTLGRVPADSLAQIWDAAAPLAALRRRDMDGCAQCPSAPHCAVCPGIQEQLAGDPRRPAAQVCDRNRTWLQAGEEAGSDGSGGAPPEPCA